MIGGRPFVNNASFGVYAEMVQSPEYRDDKTRTVLEMLPDLLAGHSGARLRRASRRRHGARPAGGAGEQRSVRRSDLAGWAVGRGWTVEFWASVAISVATPAQAVGLLRRATQRGLDQFAATEVVVDADAPRSRSESTARPC